MASGDFIPVLEGVFGVQILRCQPVRGGDIAKSYLLHTPGGPLFVKTLEGPKAYDMLTAEAGGLSALKEPGVHLNIFGRSYLASVTDSVGAVFGAH